MTHESTHWKAGERIHGAYCIPSIGIRRAASSAERRPLRDTFLSHAILRNAAKAAALWRKITGKEKP